MLALFVSLGQWQGRRAEEKRVLQATLEARQVESPVVLTGAVRDAEPLLFRRVRVRGEYLGEKQLFIDNRIHEGQAGFEVVTPLRISGAPDSVLVDRGWIARDAAIYPRHPAVAVPAGEVEVAGLAIQPPRRVLELSGDTVEGDTWQNLHVDRIAKATGLALLPLVVLADPPGAGLAGAHERPDTGMEKHLEYRLTWYALAVTTLVLWLVLNGKRSP